MDTNKRRRLVLSNGVEIDDGESYLEKAIQRRGVIQPSLVDQIIDDIFAVHTQDQAKIDALISRLAMKEKNPWHIKTVMKHREDISTILELMRDVFDEQVNMSRTEIEESPFYTKGKLSFISLVQMATTERCNFQSSMGVARQLASIAAHGWSSPILFSSIIHTGDVFLQAGLEINAANVSNAFMYQKNSHDVEKLLSIKGTDINEICNAILTDKYGKNTKQVFFNANNALRPVASHGQLELFEILPQPPMHGVAHNEKTQSELADIARAAITHNIGTNHHPNFECHDIYLSLMQFIVMTADIAAYKNFMKSINTFRGNYNYDDQIKIVLENTYLQVIDYIKRHKLENEKNYKEIFPELSC